MRKSVCSVNHHDVLNSYNLASWLSWPRISIEEYTSGKSLETRRCPACGGEFKRQVFISAVVYPVEVALLEAPVDGQRHDLPAGPGWPADPQEFGRVLRRRREAAGLSREELCALCHVGVATIRNIETGRHRPARQSIDRLTAVSQLQEAAAREAVLAISPPPLRAEVRPVPASPAKR